MVTAWKRQLAVTMSVVRTVLQIRLQRWLTGLMWLIAAAILGLVGLVAGLISLFFELANRPEVAGPGFITAIITLLIAGLAGMESKRLWRYTKGR